MSKRIFFDYTRGNIYHYGHFIVDAVIPFANYIHTCNVSLDEICVQQEDRHQSMGGFMEHFEFIFAPITVRYLPKSEWDKRTDPVVFIKGFLAGPYPRVALDWLAYRLYKEEEEDENDTPVVDILVIRRKYVPIKIYTDRNDMDPLTGSYRRSLINHEKVLEVVRDFGSKHNLTVGDIALEKMHVKEQIRLFARASIVIGQHGAGMCNLAFTHPLIGSKHRKLASVHVLEISYWGMDTVKNLCAVQQAKHYFVDSTERNKCSLSSLQKCLHQTVL